MARMAWSVLLLTAAGTLCCWLVAASPLWAFYEWQGKKNRLELRGLARLTGSSLRNPDDDLLFRERHDEAWGAVLRLLGDCSVGERFAMQLNLLQVAASSVATGSNTTPAAGAERSGLLVREQHDSRNARAYLTLDGFNGQWTSSWVDVTVGRQPVNLATTFLFTPNDFFAPFIAQDFYRVYKPGVDGMRAEIRLGDLSQLSLISVLGYERDETTDNGWSKEPDYDRTSVVARIATTASGFEWALLGGTVRDTSIAGGSLQGELFDWLGVRAEGHFGSPEGDTGDDFVELTVGLEHRFESSLDLRLEQFHHGLGFSNIEKANAALLTGGMPTTAYLGRNYTGFGAGYEFSPLLLGQVLLIANWTDNSQLVAFNAAYSLSDESELVMNLSFPFGDKPQGLTLNSEYGTLPQAVTLEYRLYF